MCRKWKFSIKTQRCHTVWKLMPFSLSLSACKMLVIRFQISVSIAVMKPQMLTANIAWRHPISRRCAFCVLVHIINRSIYFIFIALQFDGEFIWNRGHRLNYIETLLKRREPKRNKPSKKYLIWISHVPLNGAILNRCYRQSWPTIAVLMPSLAPLCNKLCEKCRLQMWRHSFEQVSNQKTNINLNAHSKYAWSRLSFRNLRQVKDTTFFIYRLSCGVLFAPAWHSTRNVSNAIKIKIRSASIRAVIFHSEIRQTTRKPHLRSFIHPPKRSQVKNLKLAAKSQERNTLTQQMYRTLSK